MCGEICQLFSTTLHQSKGGKKERESSAGCVLQDRDSVCKPVNAFLWLRVVSLEQLR